MSTLDLGCVLIVDDEIPIRRLLRNTLKVHNYDILEAGTVHAALTLFAGEKIDIMILDLGLPDGDGIDVIRKVRESSQCRSWCCPVATTSAAR